MQICLGLSQWHSMTRSTRMYKVLLLEITTEKEMFGFVLRSLDGTTG
jgi:hypothetical protein